MSWVTWVHWVLMNRNQEIKYPNMASNFRIVSARARMNGESTTGLFGQQMSHDSWLKICLQCTIRTSYEESALNNKIYMFKVYN